MDERRRGRSDSGKVTYSSVLRLVGSSIPFCLVLLPAFVLAQPALEMNWHPVDSLNVQLPDGIRLYAGSDEALPLRAWFAHIDESTPEILTRVVVSDDPADRRETVSSFARDLGACVVVNGGYFTMDKTPAGHVGLLRIDGQVLEPATRSVKRDAQRFETTRAALGFTYEDEVRFAWITSRGDTLFAWPGPPPHRPGRPATLDSTNARSWDVRDAIGAGPALISKGEIRVTSDEEVFFGTSIPKVHPRTAAGVTEDGALILMVVDGRQPLSRGVSLEELAALMLQAGAVEALNLDGGGSSAMVVRGVLVNRPQGTLLQREVMSALATFCE